MLLCGGCEFLYPSQHLFLSTAEVKLLTGHIDLVLHSVDHTSPQHSASPCALPRRYPMHPLPWSQPTCRPLHLRSRQGVPLRRRGRRACLLMKLLELFILVFDAREEKDYVRSGVVEACRKGSFGDGGEKGVHTLLALLILEILEGSERCTTSYDLMAQATSVSAVLNLLVVILSVTYSPRVSIIPSSHPKTISKKEHLPKPNILNDLIEVVKFENVQICIEE